MTADLVEMWGRQQEVVEFPIVARARSDGRELLRLPGLTAPEDLALLAVIATDRTGPVDAYDVRDPLLVQWSSDMPTPRTSPAEARRIGEERWDRYRGLQRGREQRYLAHRAAARRGDPE